LNAGSVSVREATEADRPALCLRELHAGAVDESRKRLKPEIPETGEYGIPLRDEIVLQKEVTAWRP
jgi:hypothetical protein